MYGTKTIFNSDNLSYTQILVEDYINIKHPTILVDFCISYYDVSGNVIYPKLSTLKFMGEKPNYYQFFSLKNPCVNRYKSKYVACSKFLSKININKINFYSSTQDYFNDFYSSKFYPILSKN